MNNQSDNSTSLSYGARKESEEEKEKRHEINVS